MNNIVDYSDGSAITREACAWIAQLDGADAPSAADMEALREWMARSPAHRDEIRRLAAVWSELHVLSDLAAVHTSSPGEQHAAGWFGFKWPSAIPVLATFTALCCFIAIYAVGFDSQRYRTDIGEQRRVVLGDGSILMLNTNSYAKVDYEDDERRIQLVRGEAHFEVRKDASRPFVVIAGDQSVRAVGTAFAVRREGPSVRVSVTEGVVQLSERRSGGLWPQRKVDIQTEEPVLIDAGKVAVVSADDKDVSEVSPADLDRVLAWRGGMMVFDGDRLEDVLEEVSRYTHQQITFEDDELRDLRLGGQFRVGETQAVFHALEESFEIVVERDGDRVTLAKRKQAVRQ